MKVEQLINGKRFAVYVLVLNSGQRPALEFLDKLRIDNPSSHKSLVQLLNFHANHGPVRDKKKSRPAEGYDGIWEFKTNQGARMLYFYKENRVTILTHGFKKGTLKQERAEYKQAEKLMNAYLEGAANG